MNSNNESHIRYFELETPAGRQSVSYEFIQSRRRRNLEVCLIDSKYLVLKAPLWETEKNIVKFLKSQKWIMERSCEIKNLRSLYEYLMDEPFLSAYGKKVKIEMIFHNGEPRFEYRPQYDEVKFKINPYIGSEIQLLELLKRFAKMSVFERTFRLIGKLKLDVKRISINDQFNKWGSCNNKRNITFNWRLILLKPELLDHIIYHELAHLTHFDHSEAFHELLNSFNAMSYEHEYEIDQVSSEILKLGHMRF